MSESWDAIVIGSGIGGLTAAGLLAGVAGRRVLVLEKHSEPGGLTHVFRRDGASWDVGLHYVGEMEEGTLARSLVDYLSGRRLSWNRMPPDFERFVYPGLTFEVPSDPRAYEVRLIDRFPGEKLAIHRYFRDIRRFRRWSTRGFVGLFMPRTLGKLLGLALIPGRRGASETTGAYLRRRFRSPQLRALLASQWGDYGLPPSQSAFAIHATIVGHYLHGAWFPRGGSGHLARTFERGIEARGGALRVSQEVISIVTKDGRAVGVRIIDRRGPEPRELEHRAPVIIPDAGARTTYEHLLPTDGETGRRTQRVRAFMDGLKGGASAVTLYLRLKAPAFTIGMSGENVWVNADFDHDGVLARHRSVLDGKPGHIYVSFPSAKAGEEMFHTAEIISFVDAGLFAAWKDAPKGNRGAEYSTLKGRISDGLLELAETAIPGLTELVAYRELSAPLTVEHYTSRREGMFYGLPAVPRRYESTLLDPATPIPGLYLSGSDAGCLGIVGALMGGVAAATKVLGPNGFLRIMAAVRGRRAGGIAVNHPSARAPEKARAVLSAKRRLTSSIWELRWTMDQPVRYAPGQFARLRVADEEWRDYSIAGAEGDTVTLLVSTRTGGPGSRFAECSPLGTETLIELPLGSYRLVPGERRRVFVATGTGLAPLLPMVKALRDSGDAARAELLFGCATRADDILPLFEPLLPPTTRVCVSREAPADGGLAGRVTAALRDLAFDPSDTGFYVCGSAAMVADCRALLEKRGARYIHTEQY